ncbi:HK97-gp10 family putative phage morphogenesis protein [Pontibacter sp. JAM-7]|uniref:HK97-gp10 family putative phage morphogenesis protein n=1 Tax=Pontibacter sp. JAM-7 TaxID=3366581 RepID=UPI003AF889C3
MEIDFKVEGLDEIEKKLIALGAETGFKTLRNAARKSMQPVLDDAKANAWEDSGDMKASLSIRTRKGKGKSNAVTAEVGSFKRTLTEKQSDGSKTKRKINRQDAKVAAQEYGVRGRAPEPFLRPALNDNAETVLGIFKKALVKAIEKATK